MGNDFDGLSDVSRPAASERGNVERFAHNLAASCSTHQQWLSVMRYGLGTLLKDQTLLLTLIDHEASREVRRGAQANETLQRIFSELGLRAEVAGGNQ